jgi:transaldolase
MSTPAARVAELGQSIWYDNLSRDLFESGALAHMVAEQGVRGVTSNPSIFQKAMTTSPLYAGEFDKLAAEGKNAEEIYETLAVEDIRSACDLLRPVYDAAGGRDGFVSLEVSPALAHDTAATVAAAKRLWGQVERENLMIKVPATPEGIPAIRELIGAGLNINVTLIFARSMYDQVMDAYLSGLEDRAARGEAIDGINSVASFFVSRVDSAIDKALGDHGDAGAALCGKAAVANAKLAYALYEERFGTDEAPSERFAPLAEKGAAVQRPLWASTSTKNPSYPDTLYVDTLIGPHTVNTIPPATLDAFNDHGHVGVTIGDGVEQARADIAAIEALGISLDTVCDDLLAAGVKSFADSFDALLGAVDERRREVAADCPFDSAPTSGA